MGGSSWIMVKLNELIVFNEEFVETLNVSEGAELCL
jgi:hypothetical protein